jgi:hypothetical protein
LVGLATIGRAIGEIRPLLAGRGFAVRDGQGRTRWRGTVRPGRMHDQTALRTEVSPNSSGLARA